MEEVSRTMLRMLSNWTESGSVTWRKCGSFPGLPIGFTPRGSGPTGFVWDSGNCVFESIPSNSF